MAFLGYSEDFDLDDDGILRDSLECKYKVGWFNGWIRKFSVCFFIQQHSELPFNPFQPMKNRFCYLPVHSMSKGKKK